MRQFGAKKEAAYAKAGGVAEEVYCFIILHLILGYF